MPLSGIHVLVIESDPDLRELMVSLLTRNRAFVTACDTAELALQSLDTTIPDCIVCNCNGIDCLTFLSQWRQREATRGISQIPSIIVFGSEREISQLRALEAGFQGITAKPLKQNQIVQSILDAIQRQ